MLIRNKKLQLNRETVRRLVVVPTVDTMLEPMEPSLCPTDGTKTCVIGR